MRVPLSWLQTFVDLTDLSAETIAEGLTCAGLEVETIDTIGPAFTQVYVAQIAVIAPHPQADKLRLVTVHLGKDETCTLVCGAPNVREGQLVPLAKEGARVYSPKQQAWFTLGQAVIRGVPSSGMICSLDELALTDMYDKPEDGIWPLNGLVDAGCIGQPLPHALGLQTDTVWHVVPTANRGDAMSIRGIARELAAIFERPLTLPELPACTPTPDEDMAITLTHPAVCTGYTAVTLDNVTVTPSPAWVVQRLTACGVRAINTVVDVTNMVMLELGQPLHAFDRDCLTGKTLDVQTGLTGELVTLDGVTRTLQADVPVVTLDNVPIALAGIMGGQSTAVTEGTTRVLLEAAHFAMSSIRRGSQALGLRTEASARFERGVDTALYTRAAQRAVELLQQLTGATVTHITTSGQPAVEMPPVTLRYDRLNALYGITLPPERVAHILTALGFDTMAQTDANLTVHVPTARQWDVTREVDLIEEVVRIAGLNDVPARLPVSSQLHGSKPDAVADTVDALRQHWVAAGFQEVMTPSLVRDQGAADAIGVLNSHSPDHTQLRQALWPSVTQVAQANLNKGQSVLRLFELGRVYKAQKAKPNDRFTAVQESWQCVALLTGQPQDWSVPAVASDAAGFYQLKGHVTQVLASLGMTVASGPVADAETFWHPGRVAELTVKGKRVGVVGELHPQYAVTEKLNQRVWLVTLDVSALSQLRQPPSLVTVSPYPAIQRDVALRVPAGVSHAQILQALDVARDQDVLADALLFDVYTSDRFSPGERSMAYRLTFQSLDKTLTDEVVKQRLGVASQRLKDQLGIDCPVG